MSVSTIDKSEQRVRRMFGEISPRYDFLNHLLSGGVDYYWRWRAVRTVPVCGDAPLLDVCTGTGDLAIAFWKKHRGRFAVTGTDFTPEMLVIAADKRDKLRIPSTEGPIEPPSESPSKSLKPITFLEADTQALPFPDDEFQVVSVAFGLRNVTDTRKGLREMIRVCRPGGHVAILEFSLPGNRVLRGLYLWYFKHVLPRIGQLLMRNRQSAYNYLPESVSAFPYGEALAAVLRECGLENVTWTPYTFGVATLYVGRKPGAA